MRSIILKNKYVKKLKNDYKVRKFYSKGKKPGSGSEMILFWSTGGMIVQTNLEGAVASALKLRGHNVHMILCDGTYKACARRVDFPDVEMKDWGKYCRSCIRQNSQLLDKLGITYTYIGDLMSEQRVKELRKSADEVTLDNFKKLKLNEAELGTHLESAMTRHTKGGAFDGLEIILKEYAFTVLINAEASLAAMKRFKPTRVYMSHGIYADWGPALSVFLLNKIPVISYICCYLNAHFYFGTVREFNQTFLTISEKSWTNSGKSELNEEQRQRLENFLSRRYKNNVTRDMKGLLKDYRGDRDYFMKKYELDESKPVWGIMTHINWDAVSDYFPMLYKNFDEWLYETVKEIYKVKDVQWLIKIHPSELNDNPETGCQKFIEKNFAGLPSHIKVIKMDDDISPLDFYGLLDGAVTVMGTGGLELSVQGKPVILAGDAHYSKKGFTYDAKNDEHYKKLLRDTKKIKNLDEEKLSLAWKYAYIYFIQKQIPLIPAIDENLYLDFEHLGSLIPNKNQFIDFICERIIDGEDFILPEKLVELAQIPEKEQLNKIL
jgi:hypothetical protein